MSSILLGLIPLILFAVLDSVANLNIALAVAILATILEAGYTIYKFGQLDAISVFSIVLVLFLIGMAYIKQQSILVKLKPAVLKAVIGLYFLITYWMGKPIFIELLTKYPELSTPEVQAMLMNPKGIQYFTIISFYFGFNRV